MKQIMITFQQIINHDPCADGWAKLLLAKGVIDQETHDKWVKHDSYDMGGISLPDTPFPLSDALETNGLDDTIWALKCIYDQNLARKFAIWCVYQIEHLMNDQRSKDVLRVAWAYLDGNATKEELSDAARAAQEQKLKEILDTGECPCPWGEK